MRVLLVDPDPAARRSRAALLRGASLQVEEASSAADAASAVARDAPDLVVVSRALPEGDALERLRHIKGPEEGFVPVLVLVDGGTTARVLALQRGADDVLGPWVDPDELLARVRALLRSKRTHERTLAMQRDLERLVVSDPLTGLYNRRYLLERLAQEMQRVDRYGGQLAFAMIDLDEFKPVNDAYGHVFGDSVLRAVADRIAHSLRAMDVAARYGGDEFAVILPQATPDGALRVCERIRRAIAGLRQKVGDRDASVTASLGVAEYPAEGIAAPEQLVHAADEALYVAKRGGKNRYSAVRAA